MNLLCIDVGNTSTHYGLVEDRQVVETNDLLTDDFRKVPPLEFTKRIDDLSKRAEGVSVCSVVPDVDRHLKATLALMEVPLFHLNCANCKGLPLAYPRPEEIGQDRIANAIAAQEFYGVPAIVIDMGTAVTFDIVTSRGYEGGLIAPGLEVMTRYLHEQTALLPEIDPEDLVDLEGGIGQSTVNAMRLGTTVGFSGMIQALKKHVCHEITAMEGKEPVILFTGGSMANLTKDWTEKSLFVENLTLLGLAVAFERNQ